MLNKGNWIECRFSDEGRNDSCSALLGVEFVKHENGGSVERVEGVGETFRVRFDVPPNVSVTAVPEGILRVVNTLFLGKRPQKRVP